jgi:hydrogenase maturation protease
MSTSGDVLILGLGNRLMSDDAAGVLVIERLAQMDPVGARVLDGGTLGMALLPEIQASNGVIAVDAAWFDAAPGVVAVFEGREMERMLGGVKKTAHEVALSDLIGAAMVSGTCPVRHEGVDGRVANEQIAVTRIPAILITHPEDLAVGAARLQDLIAASEMPEQEAAL